MYMDKNNVLVTRINLGLKLHFKESQSMVSSDILDASLCSVFHIRWFGRRIKIVQEN